VDQERGGDGGGGRDLLRRRRGNSVRSCHWKVEDDQPLRSLWVPCRALQVYLLRICSSGRAKMEQLLVRQMPEWICADVCMET
jgi:hypothetical protein